MQVIAAARTQYLAMVGGAIDPSVLWSVNGVTGGSSSVGTIDINGVYTAPHQRAVPEYSMDICNGREFAASGGESVMLLQSGPLIHIPIS